ncbi:MAG: hypothetical protein EAY75_13520 [Bacteroidetes bacterium]|nr:MAG: hypothetical protein EAY75_13520 [Bacteroidota bacterium]
MKNVIYFCMLLSVLAAACKKKCELAAHYVVPMYLKISPSPTVRLGTDTIRVTASVPYNTADLRLSGYPVSLKKYKPSNLFFGLSPCPTNDSGRPIDPFKTGLMELVVVSGKAIGRRESLLFDFAAGDTAWVVSFNLVPKKPFNGIYFLRPFQIQYMDECMQIDPVAILVNTPTSHHLARERLNWPLAPYENDVFFYVK